ncbi:hypothetical protein PAPYR_4803 [Paratrimastix pyriformis]|uniref:Uncharacterized protein n=1 Tax=Paratrimastix pyriformis TaxID=342808 RepID=A0ABQ8UJ71_9EUKA|nr:hypothetical protein PAPYR_4803 [Paratrimastix pyriformis]
MMEQLSLNSESDPHPMLASTATFPSANPSTEQPWSVFDDNTASLIDLLELSLNSESDPHPMPVSTVTFRWVDLSTDLSTDFEDLLDHTPAVRPDSTASGDRFYPISQSRVCKNSLSISGLGCEEVRVADPLGGQ